MYNASMLWASPVPGCINRSQRSLGSIPGAEVILLSQRHGRARWDLGPHLLLLLFNHSFVSDSLQFHGLQHARFPCPSLSPGVCSNARPLSQWCHPTISSSVGSFSSFPQSFRASESFPVSRCFTPGGQSIGASASSSVLPMNIQGYPTANCSQENMMDWRGGQKVSWRITPVKKLKQLDNYGLSNKGGWQVWGIRCPRCCCQLFTWIISFHSHNQQYMVATTISSIFQMEAKRENARQYNLSMEESEFHSRRSGLELLDLTTMLHYPLFQPLGRAGGRRAGWWRQGVI